MVEKVEAGELKAPWLDTDQDFPRVDQVLATAYTFFNKSIPVRSKI